MLRGGIGGGSPAAAVSSLARLVLLRLGSGCPTSASTLHTTSPASASRHNSHNGSGGRHHNNHHAPSRPAAAATPPIIPPPPPPSSAAASPATTPTIPTTTTTTTTALAAAQSAAEDKAGRPTTPWVRQVISGVDLMRHPKYNKGLAFSEAERDRLYLRGLLPPAVLTQEVQLERAILNVRGKEDALDKYTYMASLQNRNERLYYRVLLEHFEELLPVVSTPTVRLACQRYGLMFRSLPRGLFVTLEDRGRVFRILKNWPERNVRVVVLTDGERVGELGDLGVQAIGVPLSKIALHTACGGVEPATCMPVVVDVGTDNEDLLRSPLYVGARRRRARGDAYLALVDELLTAVRRRYGNTTLIHLEDLAHDNASRLLQMYRGDFPCYSDDLQGTGAAVLAALLGALGTQPRAAAGAGAGGGGGGAAAAAVAARKLGGGGAASSGGGVGVAAAAVAARLGGAPSSAVAGSSAAATASSPLGGSPPLASSASLADQTVVLAGEGPGASAVAELLAAAVAAQTGATVLEARRNIWLVDSAGLVTRERGDASTLEDYKLPYCHPAPPAPAAVSSSCSSSSNKAGGGKKGGAGAATAAAHSSDDDDDGADRNNAGAPTTADDDDGAAAYAAAHAPALCPDLLSAVKALRPSALIGLSTDGAPPPFAFDAAVLGAMAEGCARPVVMPLSAAAPECSAAEAYAHTGGRAVVAVETPPSAEPVICAATGQPKHPSQVTTAYIFPGVALGVLISRCTKLRDEQLIAGAEAIARLVTDEERSAGACLPALARARECAAHVAARVAQKAYEGGFATDLPKPHSLIDKARAVMYQPAYRRYR
jgi:malic enzyme